MKSKLKLAIYEACENGVISAEDAQTYLNFVECADLDDAEDVTVLTEMVDAISCADDEAVYESAEEYVLDYLMEKAEKAEKASLKDKLTKKKAEPEKKSAQLKAKIAANKGKILKGAAIAGGVGATVVAGVKNKDKIADALKNVKHDISMNTAARRQAKGIRKGKITAGDDVDTSYVDAFGTTESVEALVYESVECGDISVSEAAELLELLAE